MRALSRPACPPPGPEVMLNLGTQQLRPNAILLLQEGRQVTFA
jgi:hypothetical protein